MKHAKVGSLAVSRVGFGCYGMSGAYGTVKPDAWRSQVELALELGVTLFDVAAAYGEAEEWLGRWLGPRRSHVVVATKFGIGRDLVPDASAAAVVRSCEESLRRLGTEWIDLYMVHFDDPETPVAETVTALEALQRRGWIKEYGVSHLPAQRVLEYLRVGRPAAVMCEVSLVAREALSETLGPAHAAGAAGLAFSPTGRGLLTGAVTDQTAFEAGDIRLLDPLFAGESRALGIQMAAELAAVGLELGVSAARVAVAWVLAQPEVDAVLTGPAQAQHLRDNVAAADLEMPAELVAALAGRSAELERERAERALLEMRVTLRGPLDAATGRAVQRLLGAMETAIRAGFAAEHEILPLAMRLLRPERDVNPPSYGELETIRREMADLLAKARGCNGTGQRLTQA